jgi:uncharacterized membrane protein YjjP (DUF1212 family)
MDETATRTHIGDRELREFLLYLGSALTAAGEAVNEIQNRLRRVAAAYGAPHARFSVLPTYVVLSLAPGSAATLEPTYQLRGGLRLDQTAALYDLLRIAEKGGIPPVEGSRRVRDVVAMPPRFGRALQVLGHAVLVVGICLILQPTGATWSWRRCSGCWSAPSRSSVRAGRACRC